MSPIDSRLQAPPLLADDQAWRPLVVGVADDNLIRRGRACDLIGLEPSRAVRFGSTFLDQRNVVERGPVSADDPGLALV
jgi:hypothetical protein